MPVPTTYDVGLTSLSLIVAILVTGVGFFVASRGRGTIGAFASGGLSMGAGICSMP
jgi:NO-binding membrane sensor protein with MHYT domain